MTECSISTFYSILILKIVNALGWHGNVVNGEWEGVWSKIWNSDGSFDQETYSSGVLNGYSGSWNADGSPFTKYGNFGNYVNGKKDGVWTLTLSSCSQGYYETKTYINGTPEEGSRKCWIKDGNPTGCLGDTPWDGGTSCN